MYTMKQFILIGLLLTACGPSDQQFCTCMEAGEEFNKIAAEMLESDAASNDEKKAQFADLKKKKETACADYQTMSGEEMLKRKAECD